MKVMRRFQRRVVELDSEDVFKVMSDNYELNDFTITLMSDCKFLASGFEEVIFSHLLKEGNKCDDFLANLGQVKDWSTTGLRGSSEMFVGALTCRCW